MLKLCCNLYENTSIISEKMYALNPSGGNRPTGNAGRRSAPWRPALGLALTRLHQRFFVVEIELVPACGLHEQTDPVEL